MVKRYDLETEYNYIACEDQVVPVEDPKGAWVQFEDYAKLAATVEALRKDKSDLLAYVNDAERWFNRHDPNGYVSPKRETAQQHLRNVRAEAIDDAVSHAFNKLKAWHEISDFASEISEYAERVKEGE